MMVDNLGLRNSTAHHRLTPVSPVTVVSLFMIRPGKQIGYPCHTFGNCPFQAVSQGTEPSPAVLMTNAPLSLLEGNHTIAAFCLSIIAFAIRIMIAERMRAVNA